MQLMKTLLMLVPGLFFLSLAVSQEQNFRSAILDECIHAENCYCDYQCHASNDCCSAVNGSQPVLTFEETALQPTCVSFENIFQDNSVNPTNKYVEAITQCHNKSTSKKVKTSCSEADLRLVAYQEANLLQWLKTHVLLIAPVVSSRDMRLYGNVYCAICNGQRRDQLHFFPIHLGCRRENNTIECLVSVKLPYSLTRPCIPTGPRLLGFQKSFASMEDIFIIPDEYLNNQYITFPLNFDQVINNRTVDHKASPEPDDRKDDANEVYFWIQIALIIFSILALTLMQVIYAANPNLRRSLAGMLTMGLGAALLVAELSFLTIAFAVSRVGNRIFCVFMTTLFLFSLLSSFTWMTLLAVQLLITFANCKHRFGAYWRLLNCRWTTKTPAARYLHGYHHTYPKKRFHKSLLVAIFLPLCIALFAVAVNERAFNLVGMTCVNSSSSFQSFSEDRQQLIRPNKTRVEVLGMLLATVDPSFCPDGSRAWFTNLGGLVVWFLVPAGTMITFNSLALLVVCIHICRLARESRINSPPQNDHERKQRKKSKNLVVICAKLAMILGVSWLVQLFAGRWQQLIMLRRILGLVNSAQGGVIAVSMLVSSKARLTLANILPDCSRGFVARGSSSRPSTSRERSTSVTSKTRTLMLLPRRNRPPTQTSGN